MKKYALFLILAVLLLTAGCAKGAHVPVQTAPPETIATQPAQAENPLDAYMDSLREQSDRIKSSLEQDPLTQADMNAKSQELYKLWDDALNHLWGELKATLPENEFAELLTDQRAWITAKEDAVAAAGKEVQGGSLYPLVVNSTAADITEVRVYELYEILKQSGDTYV